MWMTLISNRMAQAVVNTIKCSQTDYNEAEQEDESGKGQAIETKGKGKNEGIMEIQWHV